MRYKIIVALMLILGIGVIFAAQFCIPTLFSADGYLHIRMAQFLREGGPHYNFHWARFSTFAHNFADKDFLYHVLLIPFTFFPDIFWGAKLSAAIFAAVFYLLFWWGLKRYCKVRAVVPVFLAMFFCSAAFVQALSQPRNMILTLILLVFFVHALIHKKAWLLFMITALYALAHVSGPYLLLFAVMGEGVRFANERNFSRRSLGAVILGLATGVLLHPNFPNNLLVFYLNGVLVPIFSLKWGLELGAEFFPMSTREFVLFYPLIFISLFLLIAMGISRQKKISVATQTWMSVAGFFLLFSFFSRRYFWYAYPLTLISLASYISDWWESGERLSFLKEHKFARFSAIGLLAIFCGVILRNSYADFRNAAESDYRYNRHYEGVGEWMSKYLPPGEVVFHSNWSDSQYLIGINPKNDYFVTLDPIYMYYWNPKLYRLYRDIAFGGSEDPYALLKEKFGVHYGYVGKTYFSGLIRQIRGDSRFEVLVEDPFGLVFKLKS
ncbi:MAG: hypothetical protein QME65_00315 [Candidatus Omnitrophota bacterium]|nr:hypothetical protein [Candidatus Omnitrophota bacterium]